MPEPMLSIRKLSSSYGLARVLHDVTLELPAGVAMGITGRNGAGKTTLLRTIAGVHRQCTGAVSVNGREVLGLPAHLIAKQGVSLVREGSPVFGEMTVAENIELGTSLARRRRLAPWPLEEMFAVFPVLESIAARRAGLLSGGQRQMLALATAMISRPTLLLLDEPSAGLAPEAAASAFTAIRDLTSTGVTILIAEQNHDWLAGVASSAYQLEEGRISSQPLRV